VIGLDTNVLVRYLAQDDARQSPLATRQIESLTPGAPGHVSLVTLVELVWVLTGCYGSTREEIVTVLDALLRTQGLVVAQADTVWQALRLYRGGKADFADCLIERCNAKTGCAETVTFDRAAAKHCGMRLLG
jgi:predicted nucleic-acid-binding protein